MNGKTRPMKKKLSQFTDPAMMNAAGREVCVNSSVVKMLVTPPSEKKKEVEYFIDVTSEDRAGESYYLSHLPGPRPKLKINAKTQAMLKYGKTGLTSWLRRNHTEEMLQ